jgi:hypothetical protein
MNEDIVEYSKVELVLPKCKLTNNGMGLIVDNGLTKNELIEIGKNLKTIESANQFWVGDWINANWGKYEHGKYDEAEKLGYEKDAVRDYDYVSKKVKSAVRTADLSFHHHKQVAKFPETEQIEWLQKAVDNKWSVRDLKNAMKEENNLIYIL